MLSKWERPLELPPSTLNGSRQVEVLHQSGKALPATDTADCSHHPMFQEISVATVFFLKTIFPLFFASDFSFEESSKQASQPGSTQASNHTSKEPREESQQASKGGRGTASGKPAYLLASQPASKGGREHNPIRNKHLKEPNHP